MTCLAAELLRNPFDDASREKVPHIILFDAVVDSVSTNVVAWIAF